MFDDIRVQQAGIVTRAQAQAAGIPWSTVRCRLLSGRWQRVHAAVYATFTGPLPRESVLWAAVLRAGPGALLSHETAGELVGLCTPGREIHVSVPSRRRVSGVRGVMVHSYTRVDAQAHPGRLPPQTRVEATVIDLTQTAATIEDAIGWLAAACGQRLTTARRLAVAMDQRLKVRWRAELTQALADVAEGCHSVLERRYLRGVERAHGLPRGCRQARRRGLSRSRSDDVRYDEYRLVVELDGRVAHPDDRRWRDMRRDNASTTAGDRVLRYGWTDVTAHPCAVTAQVTTALRMAGWAAAPRRCGPTCVIPSI